MNQQELEAYIISQKHLLTKEEITINLLQKGFTAEQIIKAYDDITALNVQQTFSASANGGSPNLDASMEFLAREEKRKEQTLFRSAFHISFSMFFFLLVGLGLLFGPRYLLAKSYDMKADQARNKGDLATAAVYDAKSQETMKQEIFKQWFSYFTLLGNVIQGIDSFGQTQITSSSSAQVTQITYTTSQEKAYDIVRKTDLRQYASMLELYRMDHNEYPPGIITTERRLAKTDLDLCSLLVPKYAARLPKDPVTSISNKPPTVENCSESYDTGFTVKLTAQETIFLNAPLARQPINSTTLSLP